MMPGARPADASPLPTLAEINVTPFIDVVLVLLVVFMIAAPLALSELPLRLPKSAAAPARLPSAPLVVSLTRDGSLHLDHQPVSPEQLARALGARLAGDPELVVHVRADAGLPYSEVVRLLGELARLGAGRLALLSEEDGK